MHQSPRFFRLTATAAAGALLWETIMPLAAIAQPAPPPLPPAPSLPSAAGQPEQNQPDPPARVGRVAGVTGTASFHEQGDTQWSPASINYPVSSGDSFWTEPAATAELEISASRIVMAGGTEFDIASLDTSGLQAVAAQGEAYLWLRDLAPNESWTVQTPRGLVRLDGPGRYDIIVGTTDQPTEITVLQGAAQIDGAGLSLHVSANQTATITGADRFEGSVGPARVTAFVTARLNAERPPQPAAIPIPAQVAAMPGGDDLYTVGSWAAVPDYGEVWYPPVSSSWVPYREGHWAYVTPWGWTWIDDAPWGFAPFHYGRWIEIGGRWAWTPGVAAVAGPPVYAPALVTFIGIGAGVALGAALASGTIGWIPLGPREPFRPWYHTSPAYLREVNAYHGVSINNTVAINSFANRSAATSVPVAAMTGSRPIGGVARPVRPAEFASARPIVGYQPVRPTATTAGVTPAAARQMHLAPSASVRPAPGPAVRPNLRAPGGATGAAIAHPAVPQPPHASQPNRPFSPAPEVVHPSAPTAAGQRQERPIAPAPTLTGGHPPAPTAAPRPMPRVITPENAQGSEPRRQPETFHQPGEQPRSQPPAQFRPQPAAPEVQHMPRPGGPAAPAFRPPPQHPVAPSVAHPGPAQNDRKQEQR